MDSFLSIRTMMPVFIIILFSLNTETQAAEAPTENAIKSLHDQSINQIEQDKNRKEKLLKTERGERSTKQETNKEIIHFPDEKTCYVIDKVSWKKDNSTLNLRTLDYFTHQAQGKCLGIKGIRLLTKVLQDEIIRLGYITTRINLPEQDLNKRELYFDINAGKISKIRLKEGGSNYINLKTTLPFREGDLLSLSELEQGSFNLQHVAGSQVRLNVIPGERKGESEILINRYQDKYWQVSAWMDDAGNESTGRYQAGGALYLNNVTSLSDTLFISAGHDLNHRNKPEGNNNQSIGYSVPFGFWWMDLYASQSRYKQHIEGNSLDWMLNNKNYYFSTQISRLLSHTVHQKSIVELQIFNAGTHYYYNDYELTSMHKRNAGWKVRLQHQHYFDNAAVSASLSYQKKMPWFSSSKTVEQQYGLIDSAGRIITLDLQGSMNFSLLGQILNYSPRFNLQLSPDTLSSLDRYSLGNRWTVRGFNGENNLQDNQGWFFSNDLSWVFAGKSYQPYLGIDFGQVIGDYSQQYYSGRTLTGSVAGLRGRLWNTHYDFFFGAPLYKPQGLHTDPLNLGFSLYWKY